jgi:TonB family protein
MGKVMTMKEPAPKRLGQSRVRPIALLVIGLIFPAHRLSTIGTMAGVEDNNIERFATRKVQPAYPAAAEKYRISGTVTVEVDVDSDGKVVQAEMVRGSTVFRSVSLDAAKRWVFKPPSNEALRGSINFVFKAAAG